MTQPTFPEEFLVRMQDMLGREDEAFFAALQEEPKKALRFNPLKSLVPDDYSDSLSLGKNVPWEAMGKYYDTFAAGKHPFHEAGVYYIQEPSAMAPVSYLDVRENLRILDLCAAPGGKSTQIAGMMMGTGLLVSNEIVPKRAKILSENIERMGISNAIVTNESPQRLADYFPGYFDRILVDAPCSGEGMFRKNCDAASEWSKENVILCAHRQDDILESADIMLKCGGRLVFSTCTFAPDEDEGTVARFLNRHPEYRLVEVPLYEGMERGRADYLNYAFEENDAYLSADISGSVRIWPHKFQGEGHFIAVLEKGPFSDTFGKITLAPASKGGLQKSLSKKEISDFTEFQNNLINKEMFNSDNSTFIKFGDNLYRLPKDAPNLKGLKVERPGLHLGTYLKNRFEPAHALSHFLSATEAVNAYDMLSDCPEVKMYLNGQALRPSDGLLRINNEKSGWVLVSVEGFSLGWGKYAGGMIKNHYPKGLRISY